MPFKMPVCEAVDQQRQHEAPACCCVIFSRLLQDVTVENYSNVLVVEEQPFLKQQKIIKPDVELFFLTLKYCFNNKT